MLFESKVLEKFHRERAEGHASKSNRKVKKQLSEMGRAGLGSHAAWVQVQR